MRANMYKGKQVNTKEWIYGCLLYHNGIPYIIPDDGDLSSIEQYAIDENTICEHTGLYNGGAEDIWEHDYVKLWYPYCETEDDEIYEVRKEYDCPGGSWSCSAFILDGAGNSNFMSFEDTIYDYTNEITVEIVGNKFDGVKKNG